MDYLDTDAQPPGGINADRRQGRDLSELLGLAKGVLADGLVCQREADLIRQWVQAHPDVTDTWPGNVLARRLERIYADGTVDPEERVDLAALLGELVGGTAGLFVGQGAPTSLPLDQPPPDLVFPDRTFVLTGRFAFGPRRACQAAVKALGGIADNDVTRRTDYLVIGTFCSRDWAHTSYGRKIERAVGLRDEGKALAIVSEDVWASGL